jgi:putative hemolysin
VQWVNARTARIRGTFPIDDFSEQFHIELPTEPFHTLAGLVFDRLGRMPKVGDQVRMDGIRLRVLAIKGLRISLLEATFARPPAVRAPDRSV